MKRRILVSLLNASLVATAACGETRLNVGSKDGGPAEVGELYEGTPSNSFGFDCSMPAPDFVAGTWIGQFDTLRLPSGSNALRIDVKGYSAQFDGVCGTVVFGEGEPLPATTDASKYPPGISGNPARDASMTVREGFPYEIAGGGSIRVDAGADNIPSFSGLRGNHLEFPIFARQIFNAWCEMQRSYAETVRTTFGSGGGTVGTSYSCFPVSALVPPTAGEAACDAGAVEGITVRGISCEQAQVCASGYCTCGGAGHGGIFADPDAKGCSMSPSPSVSFDFHVDGETMSGAVAISGLQLAHLTRQ